MVRIRNSGCRGGLSFILKYVSFLGLLFLLLAAVEVPARAYVDPGTGTMFFQVLAAAFLGAVFHVRKAIRWFRVKRKD